MITLRLAALAAACATLAACGGGGDRAPSASDDDAPASAQATPAPAPAPVPADQPAASDAAGVSLTTADEKLATGQFYDAYPLTVAAGKGTIITVTSRGFQPVIVIVDSDRQKVSETEALTANADGSWTVEMSDTLPAGDYFVLVAAAEVGATGPYTIEAQTSTPIG